MTVDAGVCGRSCGSSWRVHGIEEPWFCDDAAALTGLKYG